MTDYTLVVNFPYSLIVECGEPDWNMKSHAPKSNISLRENAACVIIAHDLHEPSTS